MEVHVSVRFRFTALHYWENAPPKVSYLKRPHRHEFHVIAYKASPYGELNRGIEFIQLKEAMLAFVRGKWENQELPFSCEQMARELLKTFQLSSCEVLEDGENGGMVIA